MLCINTRLYGTHRAHRRYGTHRADGYLHLLVPFSR